jgi:hypothetical protein
MSRRLWPRTPPQPSGCCPLEGGFSREFFMPLWAAIVAMKMSVIRGVGVGCVRRFLP